MTIATSTNKVVCQGNGATTAFAYNFRIPAAANAVVTYTDASGNQTVLSPSAYTISGLGVATGGTVTYSPGGVPIASGTTVTIQRVMPYQQLTSLVNQSGYYPDVVEAALDNLEEQIQQLATYSALSIQMPGTDPVAPSVVLPPASLRANTGIIFDGSGNVTVGPVPANVGAAAAAALVSQNAAAGSAGTASTQAGIATTQASAATVASATVGTYPNSAATTVPSGVTSGQGYWVQSADGGTLVRYKNVSGTATLDSSIAPVPTANSLVQSLKWASGAGDSNGNLGYAVRLSGVSTADRQAYQSAGAYDYDINYFPVFGQSLAVGQAVPALSGVQKFDNIMFVDGLRHQYDNPSDTDAVAYASFVPAVEIQSPLQTTLAETPCMGAGDTIKELMLAEDGLTYTAQNYQMLLSAPGFGATAISGFQKGTSTYTRLTTQATYGAANAATANNSFAVQAVGWVQGEQDYLIGTSQATYLASLNQMVSDLNTDLKVITGQTKSIPLISYQIASHKVGGSATPTIALAHLQASNTNPLVYVAFPMYIFRYQDTNNFHVRATESREMGAWLGFVYKRVVIDKVAWSPLQPISSTKSGKIAIVTFHVPVGSLVLDTSLVAMNTNYGFELVDSGNNPLTISAISLRGSNQVKVLAAATIPAGAKLRYAWSGASNVGRLTGPRGNLRDQQGDSVPGRKGVRFDPNGINKPMHNYCVIFEWSL